MALQEWLGTHALPGTGIIPNVRETLFSPACPHLHPSDDCLAPERGNAEIHSHWLPRRRDTGVAPCAQFTLGTSVLSHPFPPSPSLLRDPRKELSLAEILAEFQGCWLGLVGWCGWMEWGWGDTMS